MLLQGPRSSLKITPSNCCQVGGGDRQEQGPSPEHTVAAWERQGVTRHQKGNAPRRTPSTSTWTAGAAPPHAEQNLHPKQLNTSRVNRLTRSVSPRMGQVEALLSFKGLGMYRGGEDAERAAESISAALLQFALSVPSIQNAQFCSRKCRESPQTQQKMLGH